MPERTSLVLQGTPESETTAYSVLANAAREDTFSDAVFVAPFVTQVGVRMLNAIAQDAEVHRLLWLVGLDGAITSPAALNEVAGLDIATLWGCANDGSCPPLHAKLFALRRRSPSAVIMYVGSANATQGGLMENIEAGILIEASGTHADRLAAQVDAWISDVLVSSRFAELSPRELDAYRARYRRPQGLVRRVSRVVGALGRRPTARSVVPRGDRTWIEIAVRGGSGNQIEICKTMAPFFTRGASTDRVDFDLIDGASGIPYDRNAYRFRSGNAGYRIEVNTDLARALDLRSASQRRDIISFERTSRPHEYIVRVHPARAAATRRMIDEGRRAGRVGKTIEGPSGRQYYV